MEATLADNITTTTNGPYVALQVKNATQPVPVQIVGKGLGTSGAFSATIQIQESNDASSFSTTATVGVSGTAESKPIAYVHVARKAYIRLNVSAISGTGAAVYASCQV
jgi:hypothetical protein